MLFDFQNMFLVAVGVVNAFLALLISFKGTDKKINIIYSLNIVTIIGWVFSMIMYRSSDVSSILFWTLGLYFVPTLIASSFLYFTYIFPKNDHIGLIKTFLIFFGNMLIVFMIFFGEWIIKGAVVRHGMENEIFFGPGYIFYVVYILLYFLYAFWRLLRKYFKYTGIEQKQILFLLVGYAIAANLAFITNLTLPWFGYFTLNWVGQVFTLFMVGFTVYAILKHHLMDVKVLATEFFSAVLFIVLFVQFVLSETLQQYLFNGVLVAGFAVFGILLVRSVLREVENREKIERLAKELESANEQLMVLDKAKSEFVTITSHQLRAPLTAIKGYSSMLLEGSYGKLTEKIKVPLDKIFQSSHSLVLLIEEFLNLSRIERGKIEYSFAKIDLKNLAKNVFDEFKTVNDKSVKKLDLSFGVDEKENFELLADEGKIRQVMSNLIDNAIKYTAKGFVNIEILKDKNKKTAIFSVHDSGMGMSRLSLNKIFQKFERAGESALNARTEGLGLGLFVAKKIVDAHHGRIWAESEGEGKGSAFYIELPLV